jgi:hypothetical protein
MQLGVLVIIAVGKQDRLFLANDQVMHSADMDPVGETEALPKIGKPFAVGDVCRRSYVKRIMVSRQRDQVCNSLALPLRQIFQARVVVKGPTHFLDPFTRADFFTRLFSRLFIPPLFLSRLPKFCFHSAQ